MNLKRFECENSAHSGDESHRDGAKRKQSSAFTQNTRKMNLFVSRQSRLQSHFSASRMWIMRLLIATYAIQMEDFAKCASER